MDFLSDPEWFSRSYFLLLPLSEMTIFVIANAIKQLIALSITEAVNKWVYNNEWFVIARSIFPLFQGLWRVLYTFIFTFVACLSFSYVYHICSPDFRDLQDCLLIHGVPKLSRDRHILEYFFFFLFSPIVWTLQSDCNVQFNMMLDTHLISWFLAHFRMSWGFFL